MRTRRFAFPPKCEPEQRTGRSRPLFRSPRPGEMIRLTPESFAWHVKPEAHEPEAGALGPSCGFGGKSTACHSVQERPSVCRSSARCGLRLARACRWDPSALRNDPPRLPNLPKQTVALGVHGSNQDSGGWRHAPQDARNLSRIADKLFAYFRTATPTWTRWPRSGLHGSGS